MIKVVNTIKIKKGRTDEVLPRFEKLHGIQSFDGFLGLEVWQKENAGEHDEIKVCTTWEKREDFEAWTNSDAFRARHEKREKKAQNPKDQAVIGAELTTYQVPIQHKI